MKSATEYAQLLSFLAPALGAAAALTAAAGPAGVLVVLRRDSLLALALPQVVAVGVALGLRLDWPPLLPALAVVALTLALVAWARLHHRADVLLPALYVAGLALSILVIVHSGAHLAELQNLFTGMDVAVAPADAALAAPLLLLTLLPTFLFWRRWLLLAQAPATAQVAGIHPARWHLLFLATLSTIVLVGTNTLGSVMVITMLFLPALAALPWTRRLPHTMTLATLLGLLSLAIGFVFSTEYDWPLSQSAAAAGLLLAATSLALRGFRRFLTVPHPTRTS